MYSYHGSTIFFLELTEATAVNDTRNNITHIKSLTKIGTNNAMQLMCGIEWILRGSWRLQIAK
jgi:hypothetical protein